MPEQMIKAYIRKTNLNLRFVKYEELIRMQNVFRVSLNALVTRLIQIFPQLKVTLSSRYALSQPSRLDELKQKIQSVKGDEALILPTNDFMVSQRFYEKLHQNLSDDKITPDKVHSILEMLDKFKAKYES
jgi:hypothetical protein